MASPDFTDPAFLTTYLSTTYRPLQNLVRLSGGIANYTFRATATSPESTVIIKHAGPFAARSPDILLDPIRCSFEHAVLAACLSPVTTPSGLTLQLPAVHHYDTEHHILAISDAGAQTLNLKEAFLSPSAPSLRASALGEGLGTFLASLHGWGRSPAAAGLREALAGNTWAVAVWRWATYGRLLETVPMFPAVLGDYEGVFTDVVGAPEVDGEPTVLHGDFWCGNVVLDPVAQDTVTVVDWEMAKVGQVWGDLGQMCAELYLPYQFRGKPEGLAVIGAFLLAYGKVAEEVAMRVVVHFGVHLVVFPCRVSGWGDKEQVERCVAAGAEFVERGWKKDWAWVKEGPLGAIVDDSWIAR